MKTVINEKDVKHMMPVIVPLNIFRKLMFYAQYSKGEIGGMARTIKTRKGYTLTDVRLFKQKVSPVRTIITTDTLTEFYLRLSNAEKKGWNVWWHSHGESPVFFSSRDTETIKEFAEAGLSKGLISIVINKNGDIVGRFDSDRFSDIETEIDIHDFDDNLRSACRTEIRKFVKFVESMPGDSVLYKEEPISPSNTSSATSPVLTLMNEKDMLELFRITHGGRL